MNNLLTRLNEIGRSLEKRPDGLALIGLGSVGTELERMDEWSDLDFFAIVSDGSKQRYIQNLDWLSENNPISYCFMNSPDGYKLLFEDGIFCEFAVFEVPELNGIPFTEGRTVWKRDWIPDSIRVPSRQIPSPSSASTEWLVGEAITNLYVGLGRFHRGEKLSAMRFIQWYAVDRVLDLLPRVETPLPSFVDPFAPERRIEQRSDLLKQYLPYFCPGYEHSPAAAKAILEFLEGKFEVNQSMSIEIKKLTI